MFYRAIEYRTQIYFITNNKKNPTVSQRDLWTSRSHSRDAHKLSRAPLLSRSASLMQNFLYVNTYKRRIPGRVCAPGCTFVEAPRCRRARKRF